MKKIRWLLEAIFVIIFLFPFAILPLRISQKTGESFGFLVFRLYKKRREIAIENIKKTIQTGGIKISDSPENLAKKCFGNLGISLAEIAKVYFAIGNSVIKAVRVSGIENYHNAKLKNKGVIIISGHCGNWELLSLAGGLAIDGISAVARGQNNPFLSRMVERVRDRHGNSVIYKKGALRGILSELRHNRSVGILIDQAVLPEEGVKIDFLGMKAWTTKMPALIARRTGCSVLPAFISRDINGGHTIKIYPEITLSKLENPKDALQEDVRTFSGYVEDYIRQNPSEWLWIHRRWKRAE